MNALSSSPSFHTLVDEYLRRRRNCGTYSIEQFAEEFPHLRSEILDEFPGLIVAENLQGQSYANVVLPKNLGRYKVGQEIGRGAMGIVVSATNPDLDSEVAIKLLPFARIRSVEILQRFQTEAKICAAMEHPNVVPVFDYGTDENFAFLVMRKVPGQSLDKVIAWLAKHSREKDSERTQLDWNLITSIGIQAADALHYAHEQNVIHRDIKPANLILEEDGRLWVSDFGLSKVLSSDVNLSMTGDVLGTPRYMAPEQLRGIYNVCSDVYSLGMTLYELVALKPVPDQSLVSAKQMNTKQTLALPDLKTLNPAAPTALCEIIMQALKLNPEERFASAKELSIALKQSANGTFIGDRRSKDRQAKRNLIRNAVLAGCVGLIVSLVGVYFLGPNLSDELAAALTQPDKMREILDQKESRQVVMDRIPELIETAIKTDDKEVRALFAEFATAMLEPSLGLPGDATEQQEAMGSKDLQRFMDAYVESGMKGPGLRNALQVTNEDGMARGIINRDQIERLRNEVRASEMPEEWRQHAKNQISRYLLTIENETLSMNRRWRIKNFLVSLYCANNDLDLPLSAEDLQLFIGILEKELDLAGAAVLGHGQPPNPNPIAKKQSASLQHRTQVEPNVSEFLRQIEDEPRASKIMNDLMNDEGMSALLKKIKAANEE